MGGQSPEGVVRLMVDKKTDDPLELEIITGVIVDHRQAVHTTTHITGGGGSGLVIEGYGGSQTDPIQSKTRSWTVDTVFLKAGAREESFTFATTLCRFELGAGLA